LTPCRTPRSNCSPRWWRSVDDVPRATHRPGQPLRRSDPGYRCVPGCPHLLASPAPHLRRCWGSAHHQRHRGPSRWCACAARITTP
jgi:hypothetical protein